MTGNPPGPAEALRALASLRHGRLLVLSVAVIAAVPMPMSPWLVVARALFLLVIALAAWWLAEPLQRKAEQVLRSARERSRLGKYTLHERIGSGGMAEVFRATYSPELGFEKQVAIKRLLPALAQDNEVAYLFRHEAELVSRLDHPNVVQVLDFAREGQTSFLAMELVDGLSLQALLSQGSEPLPLPAVTFLMAELAAALDYIHERTSPSGEPLRLVHRDVNPPNVLMSRTGEVKLADFGIAQALNRAPVTAPGLVRGKASYAAPEQLLGQPLDARADMFALGLMLYEALTGRRVLGQEPSPERLRARLDTLPAPSALRPGVPPGLDELTRALLSWAPAERPDAAEVRQELVQLPEACAPWPRGKPLLAQRMEAASSACALKAS